MLSQRAADALQAGRSEEAVRLFEHAVRLKPSDAALRVNLGYALRELGQFERALSAYNHAIRLKPALTEARFQRAIVLRRLGLPAEALKAYDAVLAVAPRHVGALLNRSNLQLDLGLLDQAEAGYRSVLTIDVGHLAALEGLGRVLAKTGRFDDAELTFRQVLAKKPHHPVIELELATVLKALKRPEESLGLLLSAQRVITDSDELQSLIAALRDELGQYHEALPIYDRLIASYPDRPSHRIGRASTLNGLARHDEALADAEIAIALNANLPNAWNNRGTALQHLRRLDEAMNSFRRAIELDPTQPDLHNNLGNTLRECQRWSEALEAISKAIELRPNYADAFYNRAVVWADLKNRERCVADYDEAISLKSDHVEAHFNRALCLLQHGEYQRGWDDYEWRWKLASFKPLCRKFPMPLWDGSQPLHGKSVVIHAEQGLGDTLQFVQLVPRLKALGARVILEVQKPLLGLFENFDAAEQIIDQDAERSGADFHCPLMSVPRGLALRLSDLPVATRYLRTPELHRHRWSQRLGPSNRPRIGLVWSGNPKHANDTQRSIALSELLTVLPAGPHYLSLQRDVRETDLAALRDNPWVQHFGPELEDFRDTAALCECVDLIISVDTSVAHLSGVLGRPTWVLLPFNPDFRWLLDREDSPWYPGVRLLRQPAFGDWASVLSRLNERLVAWLHP